jgi:Rieske 2Fe-2S family protein
MTAAPFDPTDSPERLRAMVDAQLRDPELAPVNYFYRSSVVYQRELENIFFKSWLWAGHVSQIPNPGDWFLYTIAEESVIVVRDSDGTIRGLINSCRHRGSRVCEKANGNNKTFVCPYHGWVYGTDGSLRGARHMEVAEGFDKSRLGSSRSASPYGSG